MTKNGVPARRIPPSLPRDFRQHALWAMLALVVLGAIGLAQMASIVVPTSLIIVLAIPAWMVLVFFLVYYVTIYPILHAAQRHKGPNQTVWLVFLAIELLGLSFGVVRLLYLFNHILPDLNGIGFYRTRPKHGTTPNNSLQQTR